VLLVKAVPPLYCTAAPASACPFEIFVTLPVTLPAVGGGLTGVRVKLADVDVFATTETICVEL
jgi:hypothetical protein